MERAFDFVVAHGDALAAARARALVDESTNQAVLPLLGEVPDATDLPACERALWLCMDLRLLASPFARALGRNLARGQGEEGAFRAPGAGDDEAVRCTGMLAGCLARSPFARPETLEAAGDFLSAHWDPDRVSNGRLADLRAHALFFANSLHDRADEVLQWCGRELERGFRMRSFDAVQTTRVLVDSDAHSLPGASFTPGELLVALLTEQALDGSFGVAGEPGDRVEATLDGLHALRRFQPASAR
jgi:hypothetical protein